MLGTLVGDINGSIYQYNNGPKTKKFKLFTEDMYFTDDSLITLAVAEVLNRHTSFTYSKENLKELKRDLVKTFVRYVKRYSDLEYGAMFYDWAFGKNNYRPYNSLGNGAPMRISPVGWVSNSIEEVKLLSYVVTSVTHNHPDSYDASEAVAMCIYLSRIGKSKEDIKKYVVTHYYPELEDLKYKELVETYDFDVTSKGTAPVAIYAFLISNSFEDCLRTAISIGGDTDTLAAISMSIAEAYYYKKEDLQYYKKQVRRYLNNDLYTTFNSFTKRFIR